MYVHGVSSYYKKVTKHTLDTLTFENNFGNYFWNSSISVDKIDMQNDHTKNENTADLNKIYKQL